MTLTTVRPQGMGFNTGRRNMVINGAMQVAQQRYVSRDSRTMVPIHWTGLRIAGAQLIRLPLMAICHRIAVPEVYTVQVKDARHVFRTAPNSARNTSYLWGGKTYSIYSIVRLRHRQ